MRCSALLNAAVVGLLLLVAWGFSTRSFHVPVLPWGGFGTGEPEEPEEPGSAATLPTPRRKCGLSRVCPPEHFAVHVRSGAANIVGPRICFEGKIVMSQVLNNVGPGLNIAVVNSENGSLEKTDFLNMNTGVPEDILAYLKAIKPGRVVIVASFDDVTKKMTDQMREVFVEMGSGMIKSVKERDSWVLVGRAAAGYRSSFEKRVASDPKTNMYEGWPSTVELGGCFPRS